MGRIGHAYVACPKISIYLSPNCMLSYFFSLVNLVFFRTTPWEAGRQLGFMKRHSGIRVNLSLRASWWRRCRSLSIRKREDRRGEKGGEGWGVAEETIVLW